MAPQSTVRCPGPALSRTSDVFATFKEEKQYEG
jgi:hypothetical protein